MFVLLSAHRWRHVSLQWLPVHIQLISVRPTFHGNVFYCLSLHLVILQTAGFTMTGKGGNLHTYSSIKRLSFLLALNQSSVSRMNTLDAALVDIIASDTLVMGRCPNVAGKLPARTMPTNTNKMLSNKQGNVGQRPHEIVALSGLICSISLRVIQGSWGNLALIIAPVWVHGLHA